MSVMLKLTNQVVMAKSVIMPRQGQSVESCIITKWHKKKGDIVKIGDILFSYETDKASFDEEAKEEGILLEVFHGEGDDVPVLSNVCAIGDEGENVNDLNPINSENVADHKEIQNKESIDVVKDSKEETLSHNELVLSKTEGKIKISPRARNLAEKSGVDYRFAVPSGPNNRIIEKDILELQKVGSMITSSAKEEYLKLDGNQFIKGTGIGGRVTTEDIKNNSYTVVKDDKEASVGVSDNIQYEEVKLSNIRKVIAKAMHNSLSSTAQLTLNASFDASDILSYRKIVKDNHEKLGISNITLNDMILFAVARTLLFHRELNAHFLDDRMLYFKNVNLGIAIDTERGLMVPTVFDANKMTLDGISKQAKKLAEECKKGSISPDSLKGGSFTVTNLGALDIENFTPILNPPQTGILGVSNIIQRVKEVNGDYVYYPAMGLSLTFDHRALDGAPAARFLKDLKNNLENFTILLCK